ncbi:Ig-like domain-containing protein [Patescibacteria group bacterium]|nr:Ig-like domain-containing protein [Patescibacteria group bacterium]
MAYKRSSRLNRIEESRNLRQAYLLIGLTILIIGSLIVFGLPIMIKVSTFMGELRSSGEISSNKDKVPPQTPLLDSYPQDTNERNIELSGKTEAGVVVSILVNDYPLDDIISDNEGLFTVFVELNEGNNVIKISAQDPAGNESTTKQVSINFDHTPPEINLTNPSQPTSSTEESKVLIQGTTEPSTYVYLNEQRLVVNVTGAFQSQHQLTEGENTLKLVAKDKAGNETEIELKITYSRF